MLKGLAELLELKSIWNSSLQFYESGLGCITVISGSHGNHMIMMSLETMTNTIKSSNASTIMATACHVNNIQKKESVVLIFEPPHEKTNILVSNMV